MLELDARANLREEFERLLLHSTIENPIIVSRRTLRTALQRILANELDSDDLVAWANSIESHDQVRYEPGFEKLIADIVFRIASPEINEPLDSESYRRLISQLV